MTDKIRLRALIDFLMDESADLGGRDDAAMDLWAYDEPEAEAALLATATNPKTDEKIAGSCGESLGQIWARQGRVDCDGFSRLKGLARVEAVVYVYDLAPDVLTTSEKDWVEEWRRKHANDQERG